MEQKAASGGGVSNPSRSANTKTSSLPQILFTISASSLFLHDRNDKENHTIGARCKFLDALFSNVYRCMICGKAFAYSKEFELHGMRLHNSDKEECMLLRKASEEEKARKRSRGPYRKSHTT